MAWQKLIPAGLIALVALVVALGALLSGSKTVAEGTYSTPQPWPCTSVAQHLDGARPGSAQEMRQLREQIRDLLRAAAAPGAELSSHPAGDAWTFRCADIPVGANKVGDAASAWRFSESVGIEEGQWPALAEPLDRLLGVRGFEGMAIRGNAREELWKWTDSTGARVKLTYVSGLVTVAVTTGLLYA